MNRRSAQTLLRVWFVAALIWNALFLTSAWRTWTAPGGSFDLASGDIAVGLVVPVIVLAAGFVVAWAFTGFRR